jgi:hypothetical protein
MFYRDDLIEHISKNTNGNDNLQETGDQK